MVGSDGTLLWLVTLESAGGGAGPTLSETAWLLQQLGLVDALNLDGGSSTGLVMGGSHRVKGRGWPALFTTDWDWCRSGTARRPAV